MGKMRKIVGVSLAVALMTALVAYVLVPKTGPSSENVVVNQPQGPATGGNNTTNSSNNSSPSPVPRVRPDKLHGENSHGPKHAVCLPLNPHVQGVAQYQGANWYRGTCPAGTVPAPHAPADFVMALVTAVAGFFGLAN